jgi:hypothetical protein
MTDDLARALGDDRTLEPSPRFTARVMDAVRADAARADARTAWWAALWPAPVGTAVALPLGVLIDAADLPAARRRSSA